MYEDNNVVWERIKVEDYDRDGIERASKKTIVGLSCEIVTFGFYLHSSRIYRIPRQFLKPATTHDLVSRSQIISEITFKNAFDTSDEYEDNEIIELLLEENYILNEVWRREKAAMVVEEPRVVFLCHSSGDKPFVRQVYSDLSNLGHKPWIDEFEIKVGDSIIQKINAATASAGYLIIFISEKSSQSAWVQREWSSALSRQLSKNDIKILPALIENCEMPSIISDLKYADFRENYNQGLSQLLQALQ